MSDEHWQHRAGSRLADRVPTPAKAPAPAEPDELAEPAEYVAFQKEVQKTRVPYRLVLRYADGAIGMMSPAYLVDVYCHSATQLTLIFTACVIHMTGTNLNDRELLNALREDKVKALTCFNARRGHTSPPPGWPVIETMLRLKPTELDRMLPKKPVE